MGIPCIIFITPWENVDSSDDINCILCDFLNNFLCRAAKSVVKESMWQKIVAAITALIALFIPQLTPPTATPGTTPAPTHIGVAEVEILASHLQIPWALAFLPSGDALVTERPGRIQLLGKDGMLVEIAQISEVKHTGEGGLLGIAVDPDFNANHYIYVYYTYDPSTLNKVVRYELSQSRIANPTTIVEAIPGSTNHNGGRLKFGPDGYLYITTGDAQNPSQAQDQNSLAGKILRWNPSASSGQVEVYSYGHRNPQGLTWDDSGQLWETEHGNSAHDEFNKIVQNANYGWPTITGTQTRAGMNSPIAQSGNTTWAPSGLSFVNGNFYFAGLRGQSLYRATPDGQITPYLVGKFGRLREVVVGPDTKLYLLTSNRDGRGNPTPDDDRIIRIDPLLLDKGR